MRLRQLPPLLPPSPRILRPRVVAYALLLALLVGLFTWQLAAREPVDANLTRVPGAPFSILPEGDVANRLRFRVHNRTGRDESFSFEAVAPEGTRIKVIGASTLELAAGEMDHVDAWIVAPKGAFLGGSAVGRFRVVAGGEGELHEMSFKLLGPSQ